jgi:amidase
VKGPMARSVADTAFMLGVIAGADPRDPGGYPCDASVFGGPLDRSFTGARVAWCPDLGGLPLDARVRSVLQARRQTLVDLGCIVEDAGPDLSGADEVFLTLRLWTSWYGMSPVLEKHRAQMKPEAVWQIESGSRITSAQLARAMVMHGEILERMRRFQEKHEFLACAVNQVPPFDASLDWPHEIAGVKMENYVAWMKSAYWITTTFRPALSVPAGFTTDGLPVGLQIVGGHRDDLGVLQLGHAFEQATGFGAKRPPVASA